MISENWPKEMATFWATFCLNMLIFSTYQTWFVVGILRFKKCFDVDVLDFNYGAVSRATRRLEKNCPIF
jgi:hypothetical protein